MFRASPWVPYPGPGLASSAAPMDAPQIDTLQDSDPSSHPGPTTLDPPQDGEPPSPRTGRFRVKLLVGEKPAGPKPDAREGSAAKGIEDGKRAPAADADIAVDVDVDVDVEANPEKDVDDDEADEEDQLIDDDDDAAPSSAPASTRPTPAPAPPKEATATRGRPRGRGRGGTASVAGTKRKRTAPHASGPGNASDTSPAPKKRKTPKEKASGLRKSTSTAAKIKTTITIPPLADHASAELSEGHTGTMPSSPVEDGPPSPTPSNATVLPPSYQPPGSGANGAADTPAAEGPAADVSAPTAPFSLAEALKDTPLPRYPLPTRPFPVQAPPKIPSGYAPVVPLDRTKLAPRHWRLAHREIRGIAGGRWFVRSWVGDKDSPLANVHLHAGPPQEPASSSGLTGLTMPKLSAPPAIKKGKASAASSRAESVQPPAAVSTASVKKKSHLSTSTVQPADDEIESVVSVDAGA